MPVLEFCHEENAHFVGDVLQFLELRAAGHLLFLAQVYLLAVELGELALEHEAVFLLPLRTVFARAAESERGGVGEKMAGLVVEPEPHGHLFHLFAYRLVLVEADGLAVFIVV